MNATPSNIDVHPFQTPPSDASRSPCPALNALCAHGHLPRSGRNISFLQLVNAIRSVYNTSLPFSLILTLTGFFLCGHNKRPTLPFVGTIDLHDLALHGGIEHDASLAHADAPTGSAYAPTTPDIALLNEVLKEAGEKETLNMADFARVRSRREAALTLHGKKLDSFHAEITRGEVALILSIIGDGEKVSTQSLRTWMGEDRLPDGWKKPERTQGFINIFKLARKVEAAINQENEEEALRTSKED